MLSNLAYTLLGIIATAYMGRIGTVAAVGLGSSTGLTVTLLFRGVFEGLTTYVGRASGARDPAAVRRWYGVYLTMALMLGGSSRWSARCCCAGCSP